LSPSAVGDTGFERVEGQTSAVVGRCTREGKKRCRDQTASCLDVDSSVGCFGFVGVERLYCFGYRDCFFALFEESGYFLDDLSQLFGWENWR
jgi:hypothetical protein